MLALFLSSFYIVFFVYINKCFEVALIVHKKKI